jgi:hypothetical protein
MKYIQLVIYVEKVEITKEKNIYAWFVESAVFIISKTNHMEHIAPSTKFWV